MECPKEDVLLAYLDGELAPLRKGEVDAHLGGCADCSALFAAAIDESFPAAPPPAAPLPADEEVTDPGSLTTGGRVDRYVVLAPIGAGAMGVVYKAYDPELGRQVALKLLRPEQDEQGDARARLLREAQAMARLSHQNVVAVYDAGTWHAQVFIAMELVEGKTLSAWLQERRRGWREVASVFLRAGHGLAEAHAAGLVHRDFKPDNVLIGDDGRVRVTDFGLARVAGDAGARAQEVPTPLRQEKLPESALHSPLTRTGSLVGSPAYMAPEQMAGGMADARSDIFSFCIALYEGLCGERPFAAATFRELREAVEQGTLAEPPRFRRLPSFLRSLLSRGLRARPDERFPTMAALLEDLERGPARRSLRNWAVVVLLIIGGSAAALTVQARRRDPSRLCPSGQPQVSRIWNEERRQAIEQVFLATPVWYAQEQVRTASRGLDAYGDAWTSMQQEFCLATRVRHEQGEEVLARRGRCLAQRLQEMSALVDLLSTADEKMVPRARSAVASLTPLARCASAGLLTAMEPPKAAGAEQRLLGANRALAEARALHALGQYKKSLALLGPVVELARELRYGALEAETLLLQGLDEDHLGQYDKAEQHLREAGIGAELARRDDVAAKAFSQLIYVAGNDLHHVDEALRWAGFAAVAIERLGGAIDLEQGRQQHLGSVLAQHGRAAEALPHLKRALRLAEENMGPNAPQNGTVVEALAVGLVLNHQYEEALPLFRRALELNEKLVRPDHPRIAQTLSNLGETMLNAGRIDEAEAPLRKAYSIFVASLGEDHIETTNSRSCLARYLREKGELEEALLLAERSVQFCEKPGNCDLKYVASAAHEAGAVLLAQGRYQEARGPLALALHGREQIADEELALTQFALAQALWPVPSERPRALQLAAKARASYATNEPRLLKQLDAWLATRGGQAQK